ncbi:MAG: sensor domain-containing diguanylate cyclase [Pseudomonadota bacterium]
MLLSKQLSVRMAWCGQSTRSARAIALFLLLAACLAPLAVQGWSSWSARQARFVEATRATANMAAALAEHANNTITTVDTVLVDLVERVEVDGDDGPALARLHRLLQKRVAELPMLQGLFVYDQHGNWVVNALERPITSVNNADREYFIFHRTHPGRAPHVGSPVRSRSSGAWIMPVSRRIEHADGSFAGVALGTVKLERFTAFYHGFDIGRQGVLLLAAEQGTVYARQSAADTARGHTPADAALDDGMLRQAYFQTGKLGSAMLRAPRDGVERLYSYRQVGAYPLMVAAALSKRELLAGWWAATVQLVGGIALLAGALAWLGSRLLRQIALGDAMERQLYAAKLSLEAQNATLSRMARTDGLTGLANRRHFDEVLQQELRRARRNRSDLALVMLDVDCFKKYNDLYGHPAGDACLRRVSAAIAGCLRRPCDLAARYGGEEFAVLLPETGEAGAAMVAERIRAEVCRQGLVHAGNAHRVVTISAGVHAVAPLEADEAAALVAGADRALYRAKSDGRNRVCGALDPQPR